MVLLTLVFSFTGVEWRDMCVLCVGVHSVSVCVCVCVCSELLGDFEL